MPYGTLYLIPSLLGSSDINQIPGETLSVVRRLTHFIAENSKEARRFLKIANPQIDQQKIKLYVFDKHETSPDWKRFLKPVFEGEDAGLLSDCGSPAIADPGSKLILTAHLNNIRVKPLVGPSSILLAWMASGMNGQQFSFHGYLPQRPEACRRSILKIEEESRRQNRTQAFIETPYRNREIMNRLLLNLRGNTLLSVSGNLTCPDEWIKTMTVSEWKKNVRDFENHLHKNPCVFLIYAGE